MKVEFRTDPAQYRHWSIDVRGEVATLTLDVDERGGPAEGYELKLNSYDLGVDIELYDAVQRLRFEHPGVRAVVITSGRDRIFSAGANIRMLAASDHSWKVNFCKFTNETRNCIEDATAHSGQTYVAALNGTASGGGYELALACDHIMLVDDRSSVVSFPELPLLGVLPGTGGLTRLVDKRGVRRDLADFFATRSEGVGGDRAVEWRLVDEVVARTAWADAVTARATEMAARSDRPPGAKGFALPPLRKYRTEEAITYGHVSAVLDRERAAVEVTIHGPEGPPAEIRDAAFWTLAFTRELDDLILDLRTNEPTLGTWIFRTTGDPDRVLAHDRFLLERCDDEGGPSGRAHQEGDHRTEVAPRWRAYDADGPEVRSEPGARSAAPVAGEPARRPAGMSHPVAPVVPRHRDGWLAREIVHYLKRTLKRLDVTSRSIVALIEPGSCFAGSLLELALAADRSYHLAGTFADDPHAPATPATVTVDAMNLGPLPMANNLTRLQTRYFRDGASLAAVCDLAGKPLLAEEAARAGLVTFALDDIDWEEEVRMAVEERRGFSPDALTGLEANCRFPGPETLETKIFGRLTAWQNWIFARPNASGQAGALRRYGTGRRADFDRKRA